MLRLLSLLALAALVAGGVTLAAASPRPISRPRPATDTPCYVDVDADGYSFGPTSSAAGGIHKENSIPGQGDDGSHSDQRSKCWGAYLDSVTVRFLDQWDSYRSMGTVEDLPCYNITGDDNQYWYFPGITLGNSANASRWHDGLGRGGMYGLDFSLFTSDHSTTENGGVDDYWPLIVSITGYGQSYDVVSMNYETMPPTPVYGWYDDEVSIDRFVWFHMDAIYIPPGPLTALAGPVARPARARAR